MDSCDSRIQPPLKNRKTELVGLFLEDKISHLPDGIICHILSLIPTKYGIRTSVLSKRWENLWALASKIDIDSNISTGSIMFPYKEELGRLEELRVTLTHSVDALFFLRDSIPIQSFKLHCQGDVLPPPLRPGSWLCAIVMCNVCELDLQLGYNFNYYKKTGYTDWDLGELPLCLFTCKTLVVLKLSGRFILNVPHYVRLPNLKTLLLDSVIYLDDALLPKLLMGCPLLEELDIIIHDWGPMGILNVGLSSLQKLKIFTKRDANSAYQIERLNPYTIVIDSQNLEFIHLTGWSDDIFLYNLPNIVEAQLDIVTRPYRNSKVIMLLRKMVNVTRLILSPSTLKSICLFPELSLPTFFNLVVLELCYGNRVPIKLIDLLHSSPKLETLYLPLGFRAFGDFSNSDSDSDIDLEFRENDPERVPECLHCSLKIVKIKYFCGEKVELNIVHYLLRNAMVLKKMTILCCHKRSSVKFIQLKAKLTNYARLSTDCQLDVLNNSLKHQSLADDDDDDDADCNDVDDDDDDDDDDVDVDVDVDIGDDDDYYNDNDVEDDDDVDDDV